MFVRREVKNKGFSVQWGIPDVRKIISQQHIRFKEDLSDEECLAVLKKVFETHDGGEGINYDIIEFWIFAMYRTRILNSRGARHGYYR